MRRLSRATVAAVVMVLSGLVGNLATGTVQVPLRWKPWVWAVVVVLAVAAITVEVHRNRSDAGPPTGGIGLDEAAGQLAEAVGEQWRQEETQRQVHDPIPIAVRWQPAAEELVDHWANICRTPAGTDPGPLPLTGQLDQVISVYRRIPSGRLLVLGKAGAGKTILTLRFVLEMLATRGTTDPVPVIFSVGSWNPTTISLRDWLTTQLLRDHPGLAAPSSTRSSLASALIVAGRILPVLDGFDEIAVGLRQPALEGLNATTMPLLLTSRPGEYAAAVTAADVLTAAAGIELDDLNFDDLASYLPRTTRKSTTIAGRVTTKWDPVLAYLRGHPASPQADNLTTVLATPLMIALARTIYSDTPHHDPSELLDTARYPTAQDLEAHLFAAFVPAVDRHPPHDQPIGGHQPRHWDPKRAEHWLKFLAIHLDILGTRDLAWWRLGNAIPRHKRGLVFGLVFGLSWPGTDLDGQSRHRACAIYQRSPCLTAAPRPSSDCQPLATSTTNEDFPRGGSWNRRARANVSALPGDRVTHRMADRRQRCACGPACPDTDHAYRPV